ncbi:MAG: glycosyltransferase family 2 protein [Candidatus Parabeggiatoa sp.]|nr:glycosyltransferase family 2 protein [Candidatus Parabeggiatoa sp.]
MSNQINHSNCELSIVMPCLNEAETLAICIKKAKSFLKNNHVQGEIIVADNGSTDGSQNIAQSHEAKVVNVTEKGYGNALMGGIHAAKGEYVIMGDADDSYDFSKLEYFLEKLRAGFELVMGNRFSGGIKSGAMPFLHRYLGNPVLSGIGKLFFKSPIGDFHCGLRGFKRKSILRLDLHTTGMEFASEMVVKATLHKLRITEVPTILHQDGRSHPPHLQSWRDGWRHLRFLLMYSPRWLFLYPGLALIAIGLLGMVLLLPGPLSIGTVTFDIHTLLLSGTAIILGVQTLMFAILAKQFAINNKLLPYDSRFISLIDKISMEKMLLIGVLMILSGIFGIGYSLFFWGTVDFGPLVSSYMMRILVPSVTLVAVGFQIIIASFFQGILSLKMR